MRLHKTKEQTHMKKDRKIALLGFFIFGAFVLGLLFIAFFGAADIFQQRKSFVLFFENSVKGLQTGSPVLLRGVKVGQVKDIQLRADREIKAMLIPVIVALDPHRIEWTGTGSQPEKVYEKLIDQGLKGQLILQSFVTGSSAVQLDFFPETASKTEPGATGYPEIPTVPSKFQELSSTFEKLPLEELANKLISSLEGMEKTFQSPAIPRTLDSLDQTMHELQLTVQNLQQNLPSLVRGMDTTLLDIQDLIRKTKQQISLAGTGFNSTQTETKKLLQQFSREAGSISSEIQKTTRSMQQVFNRFQTMLSEDQGGFLGQLSTDLKMSFATVRSTLEQTEKTLAALQDATDEDSALRFELSNALKELAAAARSMRNLTDYLERHPEALFKGKR